MRTDKALLPWKQTTVVEHLAQVAAAVAESVTLVGEPARYRHLGLPCIPDLRPGMGPLSGIEAALSATDAAWNLLLACDMPDLNPDVPGRLFACAAISNSLAVMLRDLNLTLHPLCAVYHRACLPAVQDALDRGQLRLMNLVQGLKPAYLDIDSVVRNINTPEEWAEFYSPEPHHDK